MGRAGAGVGGTLLLLVLSLLFGTNLFDSGGGDPGVVPDTVASYGTAPSAPVNETPEERTLVQFVSFVLDDAQGVWAQLLPREAGRQYQDATLVLFRGAVSSACGTAQSAMGPFYCPRDQKVYIDLQFYEELRRRYGAPGDFAQAYVIAHELGHHVQNLLGTAGRVRQLQEQRPDAANALSVRLELQADCYAGVWAHSTGERRLLEQGDVEEGLAAAAAVGDDRLQGGGVFGTANPESFTHGTSEQRASWFRRGFSAGRMDACDSFAGGI
jgi:predicted metalloprotease